MNERYCNRYICNMIYIYIYPREEKHLWSVLFCKPVALEDKVHVFARRQEIIFGAIRLTFHHILSIFSIWGGCEPQNPCSEGANFLQTFVKPVVIRYCMTYCTFIRRIVSMNMVKLFVTSHRRPVFVRCLLLNNGLWWRSSILHRLCKGFVVKVFVYQHKVCVYKHSTPPHCKM